MKIAYVGNFSQRHCTEVHLAYTLEDLGHQVTRIQENGYKPDDLPGLVNGHDLFLFTRTWGGLVTNDFLKQLDITSVSYHLDLYIGLKREDGLNNDPFWRTDYVFTPDGDPLSARVFKRKEINHYYMKPGVYKNECYMGTPRRQFAHDVAFVGGGVGYGHFKEWPYRRKLAQWLPQTYGSRYGKYGHPEPTIRNKDLNDLYASVKVIVGDSICIDFNHTFYWSDRVYETMGRGGFIIHPFIEGMQEEFKDGSNIVFYKYNDFDELKKLIDYYISHQEERKQIAFNGHQFVKNNATYHDRLTQMLGIVDV